MALKPVPSSFPNKRRKKFYRLFFPVIAALFLALLFIKWPIAAARSADYSVVRDNQSGIASSDIAQSYLPLILNVYPLPRPQAPVLHAIENSDQDAYYTVTWSEVENATLYVLEEASDRNFTSPTTIYAGPNLSWSPGTTKVPYVYYYRVRAENAGSSSDWSEVQSITIYPIHVGLVAQWDGTGEIHSFYDDLNVGTHEKYHFTKMIDNDTIEMYFHFWYDPNPEYWDESVCNVQHTLSTGAFKSSDCPSEPGDENWKWSYPMIMEYWATFTAGETVQVDGQPFSVSGPFSKTLPNGMEANYWRLTNTSKLLIYEDSDGFSQYAYPGEAVLEYEAGHYGILLTSDIRRNLFYEGEYTDQWVRYKDSLTTIRSEPASHSALTFQTTQNNGQAVPYLPSEYGHPSSIR